MPNVAVNDDNADQFADGSNLSEHTVDINGIEHTVLLDDEDAKARDDVAAKKRTVSNKARSSASSESKS